MRVLFPTPIQTAMAHAESKFDVLSRPVSPPLAAGWAQNPVPTQHVERFVSIDDGKIGFSLLNRGLPEYEACPTPEGVTLCQTLFRAVGALSRDGMITRSTHAGPAMPTPEAQCAGPLTFHYAVVPHAGSWEKARVYIEAWQHDTPVLHCLAQRQKGPFSDTSAMIRVMPDSVITSAVKGPEAGEGMIVRLFQMGSRPVHATVTFHLKVLSADQVHLNETSLRELAVHHGHQLHLQLRPREIVTLRVALAESERV
jgi:mannosylglycerate hydrolase